MANTAREKEVVKRVNVDTVKSNLMRPSLTAYFAVQIPLPTNNGAETEVAKKLREVLDTSKQEKHAYRRMFDDRVDFTFYVDADNYLPIRFFETWMKAIMNEGSEATNKSYHYRPTYPDEYTADQGLKILKFERDYKQVLTYEFFRSFPLSISSMPVSYSGNDLLKCTVSMSYIRYIQSGPTNVGGFFGDNKESLLSNPNKNPFSFDPIRQGTQILNNGINDLFNSFSNIG